MEEKFSIIIPVYNGKNVIEDCIKSILNLNYDNWELIIVNDGSTDNTESICKKFLIDSRVKLVNKKNEGVSKARNKGISEATGKYIIFVDSDDCIEANACNIFLNGIKKSDFVIAGYFKSQKSERIDTQTPIIDSITETKSIAEFSVIFGDLYKNNLINSPWAKCYKKELITVGFNSDYSIGEDLIFNLNYLINCNNICLCKEPVYYYNINTSNSLSTGLVKNGFEILKNVYKDTNILIKKIFGENHSSLKYIDEKYILDMMVMLEKNIRYNNLEFSKKDVKKIINKYSLNTLCETLSANSYEKKWKFAIQLIKKNHSNLFYLYIKLVKYIRHFIKYN